MRGLAFGASLFAAVVWTGNTVAIPLGYSMGPINQFIAAAATALVFIAMSRKDWRRWRNDY